MEKIKLNFINHSNDTNDSSIVIFQKNVATGPDEYAVAWTVIQHCGPSENHPFTYPMNCTVSASDSYGNFTPQLEAFYGQAFDMIKSTSGDILQLSTTPAVSMEEIEVRNKLQMGSINANCFKDGKLLAVKTNLVPGQHANFEFKPTIWIGVVSEIEEGQVMNAAILSEINTEINLLGIASADIVMTGGGTGASSTPFIFTLQNITML